MDDISTISKDLASLNVKINVFNFGSIWINWTLFIDVLMHANKIYGLENTVIGVGRSRDKLLKIFPSYIEDAYFNIVEIDINKKFLMI